MARKTSDPVSGCYRNPQDRRLRCRTASGNEVRPSRSVTLLVVFSTVMVMAVAVVQPLEAADAQVVPERQIISASVPLGRNIVMSTASDEIDGEVNEATTSGSTPTNPTTLSSSTIRSSVRRTTLVPTSTTRPTVRSTTVQPTTTRRTTTTPPATTATSHRPKQTVAKLGPLAGALGWTRISGAQFRRQVAAAKLTEVEYISPNLAYGTLFEDGQQVHVVMVHRSATRGMSVSPAARGHEAIGTWANALGASAGINANWYGPFDGPAVAQGDVYGGDDHGYTALFGFAADGRQVSQHHRVVNGQVDSRIIEAVAGHPTLVHSGARTTDFGGDPTFTSRQPRTAIGATRSTDVLIAVVVDGRRRDAAGMTGAETAQLMVRLGAHDAVMLDGGGSSAMWIGGRGIVNRPADPGRRVGNQIAFYG